MDGAAEVVQYQIRGAPVRPHPGLNFPVDCDIFSMRWGWGRNEGKWYYSVLEDGSFHVSLRSILSFPFRYQLDPREGFP